MRARTWATFIGVNVIVSAAVMLTILFVWERVHTPASTVPTPSTRALPLATEEPVRSLTAPPPVTSPTVGSSAQEEAPPSPLLHTVQEGDTLGALAQTYGVSIEDLMAANELTDPNVLHVNQQLIIPIGGLPFAPTTSPPAETPPEPSPPTASLPTPLPTLTSMSPPLIEIGQVLGSGNLAAEAVLIRNRGGAISLEGWTLSDVEGDAFVFPAITLFTDASVWVHSAAGTSMPSDLYWGRATPAWSGGGLITLRDAAGSVVDTYIVP